MTIGLGVIRIMVNVLLCIGKECNLICGVWKIISVNVSVIYLCCFSFVGVFEPFFQGGVSILFVTEPFLFQFWLPFEYQNPIVDLN